MKLVWGLILLLLGQTLGWFQLYGQTIWPLFKKHNIIVAILFGSTISILFAKAVQLIADHYEGILWPSRVFMFSLGIISFAAMTYFIKNESITLRDIVSLLLAITIVALQVFWK